MTENFEVCTTEIFGPFQVVSHFDDTSVDLVLEACERMEAHLTAAVVSNDVMFQNEVLGRTVNGTTYCGRRVSLACLRPESSPVLTGFISNRPARQEHPRITGSGLREIRVELESGPLRPSSWFGRATGKL